MNEQYDILILGAGIAGISSSYHIGHNRCTVLDAKKYLGGHAYSHSRDGFNWDEGPHVSFTKNEYVKSLMASSVNEQYSEFPVTILNHYYSRWIPHPAQSNLYFLDDDLKNQCYQELEKICNNFSDEPELLNYADWSNRYLGKTFTQKFTNRYTKKYWTLDPGQLSIDWIGERIYKPEINVIRNGFKAPQQSQTHYINTVRYPKNGGFKSYLTEMSVGVNVQLSTKVVEINLLTKIVRLANGSAIKYNKLINTIPLPEFIKLLDAPEEIKVAAANLSCSSLLLVNVISNKPAIKKFNWLYVYDEDKYSTRISCLESLAPQDVPKGKSGIQVEVYESRYRPFSESHSNIAQKVCNELINMGIVNEIENFHFHYVPYANVIFDLERTKNQEIIFEWLAEFGMKRENDDLHPLTSWANNSLGDNSDFKDLILAGRFGQWKYFWSDDCILRGKQIGRALKETLANKGSECI